MTDTDTDADTLHSFPSGLVGTFGPGALNPSLRVHAPGHTTHPHPHPHPHPPHPHPNSHPNQHHPNQTHGNSNGQGQGHAPHRSIPQTLATEISQFASTDFARTYFATHRRGLIWRRKVPVEEMMSWSKVCVLFCVLVFVLRLCYGALSDSFYSVY